MALWSQLPVALRSLRRSPGYAAMSIGSIAIGLALATATFAFVETVLNPRPLSPDADRVYYERLRFGDRRNPPTAGERIRLLRAIPGVEAVAIHRGARIGEVEVTKLRYAGVYHVSDNFWSFHGVTPTLGRFPSDAEARIDAAVVVSDQFWHTELNARPSLVGTTIRIGDRLVAVVGVIPTRIARGMGGDVWLPFVGTTLLDTLREPAYRSTSRVAVKLRPGVTPAQIQGDLDRIAAGLTAVYPTGNAPAYKLELTSTRTRSYGLDAMEILLYVLAFGILAIGCTNVAALTLARGMSRRRDYALRLALGASRAEIAQAVLAEVVLISFAGSAIGFAITYALLGLLAKATPLELIWMGLDIPTLNSSVFVFSALAVLAAIAMAGAFPAWRASRIAPNEPLKDGAGTTTGRSGREFRFLVIGELTVAMVLLMMASLVSLSLRNAANFDFGFPARSTLTASVRMPASATTQTPPQSDGQAFATARALRDRTVELISATPGIRSAALMGGGRMIDDKQIVSDRTASGEPILSSRTYFTAGPGFFTALGIRVTAGRDFTAGDVPGGGAAIISRQAERVLFPRGDAVGRHIKLGGLEKPGPWVRVVGVTADFSFMPAPDPEDRDPPVFLVAQDSAPTSWTVIALATQPPGSLTLLLQNQIRASMPPGARVTSRTMMEDMDRQLQFMSYFSAVFGSLGLAALGLGALGVFAVLSYIVGQREREFAVRVSLGATPSHLIRVVMRSAAEFALGGTAIGALLSFWAAAGVSGFLFGVKNTDPYSLVLTETVLITATLLAALAPALRASRANPLEIIRAA